MNHFVFVESNTTGTGQLAVQRLIARGDRVTFLTRSRAKYPFLALADSGLQVIELDTNSLPAVWETMRAIQEVENIDAVLTFSEFYVCMVAELAAALGLPGLNAAAAQTCRHKPTTRSTLRAAGLLTPEFQLLTSNPEAREFANTVSYPCVVKPPSDSSSRGVRLVRNRAEFLEHFHVLRGWKENVRGQLLNGDVLVESLLEGPEYSVETITLPRGATYVIGVTDKHLSQPPHFVEMGHDFPSRASDRVKQSLAHTALRALEAVKFNFGPAHTEIRWTVRGPVVVEINPRLAGGMIPELISYATGIDLLQVWLDLLLGRSVDLAPKYQRVASIRFLTAQEAGQIRKIGGVQEAKAVSSVREISISRQVGAAVRPAEDAYDRFGFVIGSGGDAAVVTRDLDNALKTLRVEIEPVEQPILAGYAG
jgi:S-sulfo-L-cysteine synthase (3-phospho-L-serine-dependent)